MKYLTLKGEMAKRNVKNAEISKLLGIHRSSVYNKINGKEKFYVDEAIAIKKAFFPDFEIDALFEVEEDEG